MISYSTRRLLWTCGIATAAIAPHSLGQFTSTVTGSTDVTADESTWVQVVSGNGIELPLGGTVNNGVGGVIQGDPNAIITNGPATINNAGSIAGAFNGVNFATGSSGVLNNVLGGLITSDSRAVNLDGLAAPVIITNAGQILGTGNQRNGTVYGDADALDFTINNLATGVIDAGVGNQGSGVAWEIENTNVATLINSGTITGRTTLPGIAGNDPLSGDGVRINNFAPVPHEGPERIFAGSIVNEFGGLIQSITEGPAIVGPIAGLRVADTVGFQGVGENAGTITGVQNGVYFGNGDHTGGVFTNTETGVITSDSRAFNLDGTGLLVNNAGQIIGTGNQRNGTFYADGTADDFTVNNLASGVIDAGEGNTGSGFGAEIGSAADGANTFVLTNAGTIQGRGNADAGTNAAGDGVRIGNVGNTGVAEATITNTGTIASEGANGTVAGIRFVNGISFSGTLDNSGTISGVQNGVYFGNPVLVDGELVGADHSNGVVNNTGTISSESRAFNLDGIGLTVNNSGDIIGLDNQRNGTFYADGGADDFTVNNLAGGVIDAGEGNTGSGFGAEIGSAVDGANTFNLTNAGTIQGRGNAPAGTNAAGDGVRIGNVGNIGVAEVNLTNTGTIDSEGANGTVAGIRFVNGISFDGVINNLGTISGVQNGLYFGNPVNGEGADHSNGVVNNLAGGVISSDSRAFNLDGIGLTVNNNGDIVGSGRQRNGTFYVDGTGTGFALNNLENGVIDAAGLGGEGSGISIQVGVTGDGVGTQTGSIFNAGLIAGAGDQAIDAGIRLFAPEGGDVFQGDIVNAVSGTITAETAPAVLVEEGVVFDGRLLNNGTIDGAIDLASGDVVLGDTSLVVLDLFEADLDAGSLFTTFSVTDSLEENETINLAGSLTAGGTLQLVFDSLVDLEIGDVFDVIDASSITGGFSEVLANAGVELDTSDLLIGGTVTVTAVPEPGALFLVAAGGSCILLRRRQAKA